MHGSLLRCPECDSRLIRATAYWPFDGLECVVDRSCPECGHEGAVRTSALAAWVLAQRDLRIAGRIAATADLLAKAN